MPGLTRVLRGVDVLGRFMVVFMLQIAVSITLLSGKVLAGDGDVDYSAPYITVDPETGQLVTKNPGPKLKSHPMDMSSPAETKTQVPDNAVVSKPEAGIKQNVSTPAEQSSGTEPMLTIVVTGLLVFGVLIFRRFWQKQQ